MVGRGSGLNVLSLFLVLAGTSGLGCASKADGNGPGREPAAPAGAETSPLPGDALNATWQELGVPGTSNRPALASTPVGFLALSQRSVGDSRAPSARESHLYRSADGVRWERVEVSNENQNLWLRGVAYGAGHYVLAGMRFGGGDGVVFHSTDGERWEEIPVATGAPSGLSDVVYSGSRFFALSTFRTLLSSTNGREWTRTDLSTTVSPSDVAFGNGQYLLVGSGDVQRSTDGVQWRPTQLDCAMPGACIVDPDGKVSQGARFDAVFAAGSFFIDQAVSVDGQTWRSLPGTFPLAAAGGRVLGSAGANELAWWSPKDTPHPLASVRYLDTLQGAERAARMSWNGAVDPGEQSAENFPNGLPMPERIEFPLPGGEDCTVAACLVVGPRLYLIASVP